MARRCGTVVLALAVAAFFAVLALNGRHGNGNNVIGGASPVAPFDVSTAMRAPLRCGRLFSNVNDLLDALSDEAAKIERDCTAPIRAIMDLRIKTADEILLPEAFQPIVQRWLGGDRDLYEQVTSVGEAAPSS